MRAPQLVFGFDEYEDSSKWLCFRHSAWRSPDADADFVLLLWCCLFRHGVVVVDADERRGRSRVGDDAYRLHGANIVPAALGGAVSKLEFA